MIRGCGDEYVDATVSDIHGTKYFAYLYFYSTILGFGRGRFLLESTVDLSSLSGSASTMATMRKITFLLASVQPYAIHKTS